MGQRTPVRSLIGFRIGEIPDTFITGHHAPLIRHALTSNGSFTYQTSHVTAQKKPCKAASS